MIRLLSFRLLSFLLLALGLVPLASPVAPRAPLPPLALEAGLAQIDVTPSLAPGARTVWMAGFGHDRKATGIHDRLHARAVVFHDGKSKVALVSVDLVGLFFHSAQRVRKQLPGFSHVVVSCTHNHEGPDTLGLWGRNPLVSGLDRNYLTHVEKQIVRCVKDADAARVPVTARIGTIRAPELLHDSRLPIVKHDDLVVLHLQDAKKGKDVGLVVQWNCHPETLDSKNTLLSADFVGYTVAHLRARYRCNVVYLTGTVGGLMTSLHVPVKSEKGDLLKDGTFAKTARYGQLLGRAAEKALAAARPLSLTPITARSRSVYLPLTNRMYVIARQVGVLDREAFLWLGDPRKATPVEDIEDPKKAHAIQTEIGHVRLGDLDIACIPGEIYPELVLGKVVPKAEPGADFPDAPAEPGIYAQLKGPHRMIIGLANDEIGYVIPKRQWDEKAPFCYDRKKGQYGESNSLGPETAPLLCEAFRELTGK